MKTKDKIVKRACLIDLQKNIDNKNILDNETLLSKVRNFNLPEEYKKIIVVDEYVYRNNNHSLTYRNSYELVTGYTFKNLIDIFTIINGVKFSFLPENFSVRTINKFLNDLIKSDYFEQYLYFLEEIFDIENKELEYEDKYSYKKTLKKKMKNEKID